MELGKAYIKKQDYEGLSNSKKSLLKGSSFPNIYGFFKYTPSEFAPATEQGRSLLEYQKNYFQISDLALYLDLFPNDSVAIKDFKVVYDRLKESQINYERKYGPLEFDCAFSIKNGEWLYNKCPWPWEVR